MAKQIQLTRGKHAMVDDADYPRLSGFKWHAHYNRATGCFVPCRHAGYSQKRSLSVPMYRDIMGLRTGFEVDHLNRDSLDNRRCNLRWATRRQNALNRRTRKNATGYRGVFLNHGRYTAVITISVGRKKSVGTFPTAAEAARAWNSAARRIYGAFAVLNEGV